MAKRDNERAAMILVDAALSTDAKVCEKYEITLRTLQNYRAALKTDKELSQIYEDMRRLALSKDWAQQLNWTLNGATAKLLALIEQAQDSTPETIEAVTGAITGLAEIVMTRDMLAVDLGDMETEALQS